MDCTAGELRGSVCALWVAKSDAWCYLGDDGKDEGNDQGQRPSPGAVVAIAALKKNIVMQCKQIVAHLEWCKQIVAHVEWWRIPADEDGGTTISATLVLNPHDAIDGVAGRASDVLFASNAARWGEDGSTTISVTLVPNPHTACERVFMVARDEPLASYAPHCGEDDGALREAVLIVHPLNGPGRLLLYGMHRVGGVGLAGHS